MLNLVSSWKHTSINHTVRLVELSFVWKCDSHKLLFKFLLISAFNKSHSCQAQFICVCRWLCQLININSTRCLLMITKYESTRNIVVEYYGSPLMSHICIFFLKTNSLNVSLYIDIFYWSSFPYCVMHTLIQIYFSTFYCSVIIFLISNIIDI